MSGIHLTAGGASALEDAIATVVREAALVGATITITINPVLPIPPVWSPGRDQAVVADPSKALGDPPEAMLDPPDVEADLISNLRDAPGEQLTLPEFVRLMGGTVEATRGFLRRAGRDPDSVRDWLYTRFYTKTANGRKVRTYRLTDAGRKVVHSEAWMRNEVEITAPYGV